MQSSYLQGMGGQHFYFGLWIDSEFGVGQSKAKPKCTTYGSPRLSHDENFTITNMEVWGIGKEPSVEQDSDVSSFWYTYT